MRCARRTASTTSTCLAPPRACGRRCRDGQSHRNETATAVMTDAVSRRAQELIAEGTAFVTATVVRAQRPTSAQAGDVALVLRDGTIEGFVGGLCAQNSVRVYALQ